MFKLKRLFLLFLIIIIFIASFFSIGSFPIYGSCGIYYRCGDGTILFCETFGNCDGIEVCGYYRYYEGGPIRGIYCRCGEAEWGSYCELI